MPDRSRIPRKIADLHAYINNTTNYLFQASPSDAPNMTQQIFAPQKNWERLGILPSQMKVFDTLLAQFRILYKLYSNERTRTDAIEDELRGLQIKLIDLIEQFPGSDPVIENRQED